MLIWQRRYVHRRRSRYRQPLGGNQRLLSTKVGLDRGFVSPVELGIKGGGYAARDLPLIRQVAAQVGMDPEDLAARFDPTRSGPYTPPSKMVGE
jgi:hypothetical protein